MSGLRNEDREALIDAVLDDAARQDGFTVLGPGGTDGNTPTLNEAVEQIVARHVAEARAAALNEALAAVMSLPHEPERADEPGNWKRGERHGRVRAAEAVADLAQPPP